MKWTCWALALTLIGASAGAQEAAPELTRDDFAYGIPLDLAGGAPLYGLSVPFVVYQGVVRPNLGDLRVLNGAGEVVPYHLSRPPAHEESDPAVEAVRFFAMTSEEAARPGELRLRLEGFDGTARIDVDRPSSEETTTYLIDAGDESKPVRTVRLEWEPTGETFIVDARLESSDDLTHWRSTGARGSLAQLRRDSETITRNELAAGGASERYLRLTTPRGSFPFEIRRVEIERAPETTPTELTWVDVRAVAPSESDSVEGWLFESPGALPVSRIRVAPRTENSLSRVRILARPNDDEDTGWRQRGQGRIYRFRVAGALVESTELGVSPATAERFWKLAVERRGLGSDPPTIALGYRPHLLTFLARGDGPFLLAYGSGRVRAATDGSLAHLTDEQGNALPVSSGVELGPPHELVGPAALVVDAKRDWGRWILWGVLGMASLVLVLMARSLLKQMSENPG